MIANPVIPNPASVSPAFTLNDMRVQSTVPKVASSTSALTLYGIALAVVLAIGAFLWLDPLRLFTPTEASPPAPAIAQSAEPARPTERLEIIAPQTPVAATKSVVAPIAPAPVVQAPQTPAPAVRPRAASTNPDARGNPMDKTNKSVLQAKSKENTAPPVLLTKPEEKAAPPVLLAMPEEKAASPMLTKPEEIAAPPKLLAKPEEKTDAPIVLKLGDDTNKAPKPAGTNDPTPVTQ